MLDFAKKDINCGNNSFFSPDYFQVQAVKQSLCRPNYDDLKEEEGN